MDNRQKVLIVDDEPRNLRILEEILSEICNPRSATTAEEALNILNDFVPDLILLDIMMPGMNGYELCKRVKADPKFRLTRIVLLSGKAMIEERLKGYECGADDYMTKPFAPEELNAKVQVYLKLTEAEKKLIELNNELEDKVRIRTEQLMGAEKAAHLGMMTAEIIHNLNNPITIIKGNLHILQKQYPQEERLKSMEQAVLRMQETIKSVLNSSRQSSDKSIKDIQINDVLKSELNLLQGEKFFKYQVKLETNFGELPVFQGQPSHFSQSFGNLIRNAVEAMHRRDQKELRVSTSFSNDEIIVEIQDTGYGISKENLNKIFDPFFTTKPASAKDDEPVGTGLGLASVKRMLDAYGAEIQFESEVGKGTLARVKLPLKKRGAATTPSSTQSLQSETTLKLEGQVEKDRLSALDEYQILEAPSEQVFSDLCSLAATVCQTPMSCISLVGADRIWVKASLGLGEAKDCSRDGSFCTFTISSKTPFLVEDVSKDDRFKNFPLVSGEQQVRFYAGAPLINPDGYALGSICVLDRVPRQLTAQQIACLQLISRQVMAHLEWRKTILRINKAAKKTAFGLMSTGITDEISTETEETLNNFERLRSKITSGFNDLEKLILEFDHTKTSIQKISSILKNIKTFNREIHDDAYKPEKVKDCVSQILSFWKGRLEKAGVALHISEIRDDLEIECQKAEVGSFIYQLVRNSFEAVKGSSGRWIRLDVQDLGESVEISVTDSGTISDPKTIERMFQPFYSTKNSGESLGLGLCACQSILVSHQGVFEYDRKSPNTRFYGRFPKKRK